MKISIKQLASDVAALLGESLAPECQPEESPFPDLEERVRILAPMVLSDLIMETGTFLPPGWKEIKTDVQRSEDGIVTLPLPADYLKFVSVKMSDWKKPLTVYITPDDERASPLSSKWEGVKGNRERPVALLLEDRLEIHTSSGALDFFRYMSRPKVEDGYLDVPEGLYERLVSVLKSDTL